MAGAKSSTEYMRAWHARNPGKRKEYRERHRNSPAYARTVEKRRQYREANKAWVDALKLERGCVDCGYDAHVAALNFDHLPGEEKVANVASMMSRGREAIEAEIAKCEVRCANCHAIITAERAGYGY